jgi:hypothetical protein
VNPMRYFPIGTAPAAEYAIGAELSLLKQAEDKGTVFRDNGQAKPGLQMFRARGFLGDDGSALPVLTVFDRFSRK